ncbi:MAG: hypothetical protein ACE5FM_02060 [Methyloligellaceae bacterium]
MPRSIDQIISDTEQREVDAAASGGRASAFANRIRAEALRKAKAEMIANGDLVATPDPPRKTRNAQAGR